MDKHSITQLHSSAKTPVEERFVNRGWWVCMISTGDAIQVNPWGDDVMPKRSSPKRDFMEVGSAIVEQAIGERMGRSPLPEPDTRNPHAVALASMGGRKGGKSRARKLSPANLPQNYFFYFPFFSLICGNVLGN
jgi:hypothetical protein